MDHKASRSIWLRPFPLAALLVLGALLLAACQPAAPVPVTAPTTAPTVPPAPTNTTAPAVTEHTIMVSDNAKLGKILVDEKGMTLYIYTKDTADKSNCAGDCLKAWPPVVTAGSPKAGDGVDASMFGSATLADGSKILTYNHMPLYYWVKDTKAGDTNGQNVGKVWFVVSPDGKPIMPAEATPTTSASSSEPTLMVSDDAKLGKILVDDKGMTLYIFTKDTADTSNCTADCLGNWPPLLTQGSPKAGDGVDASKLGSTTLADGRKIVTYNHRPLYYWVKDAKAGDTTGQNVGKVWFVVSPSGDPVMTVPEAAATQAPSGSEPTINVATDPKLGKILVDGKGMTLYIFTKDAAGKSNCSGACLTAWPPLLTQGKPNLGPGVDDSKIGTAALADGSKIVTYAGMPLYYYAKDTKPGDVAGQNVGKVWFVIDPDGKVNMTVP
jgi:predicted lipoprotein with Yx(FWY)xxD motif